MDNYNNNDSRFENTTSNEEVQDVRNDQAEYYYKLLRVFYDYLSTRYPETEIDSEDEIIEKFLIEWQQMCKEHANMIIENRKIAETLTADPRIAVFISEMIDGVPFRVALAKSDIFNVIPAKDEPDYEHYMNACAENKEKYRKSLEKKKQIEQNTERTKIEADVFFEKKELDEETKGDFIDYIEDVLINVFDGNIDRHILECLWKGYIYEEELRRTKLAGILEGRNTKIENQNAHFENNDRLPAPSGASNTSNQKQQIGYIESIMNNTY